MNENQMEKFNKIGTDKNRLHVNGAIYVFLNLIL